MADAKLTGKIISERRKEMGLTQLQLAQLLNISNRTVSKWENGDGFPDITMLPDISKELSISIDELLTGEKPVIENDNNELEEKEKSKLLNNYRICIVTSAFLAIFSALLGAVTELYNLSAFPIILFYNHWEIMFTAVSLGTTILSVGVFLFGAIRLNLIYSGRDIVCMSKKYAAVFTAVLCIFPITFFARVFAYVTSNLNNLVCVAAPVTAVITGLIIYGLYRLIGDKYEKDN